MSSFECLWFYCMTSKNKRTPVFFVTGIVWLSFFFFFLYSNWPTEAFMCHGFFKVTIGIAVSFFSFDIYSFSCVSFLLYTYFLNILYRHMCFKTAVDTFFFLWHILLNRLFLFPLYCLFVYMFSLSSFSTLTLYNFSNSFSIVTKISIGTLFFFFHLLLFFFKSLSLFPFIVVLVSLFFSSVWTITIYNLSNLFSITTGVKGLQWVHLSFSCLPFCPY